jgi:hypothetical protein
MVSNFHSVHDLVLGPVGRLFERGHAVDRCAHLAPLFHRRRLALDDLCDAHALYDGTFQKRLQQDVVRTVAKVNQV